ncbi:hypothetical protein D5018_11840 [Parashewanella curva]|uniref:Uncharacterized protein n=1 Tax=Parashewanella curva TaxID=2338552 RepID=A0A3L8PVV5_9GAMM|nr:hypothetical protein [Parashewanella curva]RLV59471.1 hypothetical protein D5018_11840 [Parashewanella curva]
MPNQITYKQAQAIKHALYVIIFLLVSLIVAACDNSGSNGYDGSHKNEMDILNNIDGNLASAASDLDRIANKLCPTEYDCTNAG